MFHHFPWITCGWMILLCGIILLKQGLSSQKNLLIGGWCLSASILWASYLFLLHPNCSQDYFSLVTLKIQPETLTVWLGTCLISLCILPWHCQARPALILSLLVFLFLTCEHWGGRWILVIFFFYSPVLGTVTRIGRERILFWTRHVVSTLCISLCFYDSYQQYHQWQYTKVVDPALLWAACMLYMPLWPFQGHWIQRFTQGNLLEKISFSGIWWLVCAWMLHSHEIPEWMVYGYILLLALTWLHGIGKKDVTLYWISLNPLLYVKSIASHQWELCYAVIAQGILMTIYCHKRTVSPLVRIVFLMAALCQGYASLALFPKMIGGILAILYVGIFFPLYYSSTSRYPGVGWQEFAGLAWNTAYAYRLYTLLG